MNIILDECLPKRLCPHLVGHQATTVPKAGLAGKKNGELLHSISGKFDAFLTVDLNLAAQQNVPNYPIRVVVIKSVSNKLEDILSLVPEILKAIANSKPGVATIVGG